MELINETELSVALFRNQVEEPVEKPALPKWGEEQPSEEEIDAQLAAAAKAEEEANAKVSFLNGLVAMQRFSLGPAGQLGPVEGDSTLEEVGRDREEDADFGLQLETGIYPRSGTDVVVVGHAYPERPGAARGQVRVVAGPYDVSIAVFGDRNWERKGEKLVPGAAVEFSSLPVAWSLAFGGCAEAGYGPLPLAENPDGKGYYFSEDEAEGKPLPNLEDPAHPIEAWSDCPDPVGLNFYPMNWALRVNRYTEVDRESGKITLHPERGMFDFAHPNLSGKQLEVGDEVRIEGMSAEGPIGFRVPACPAEALIAIGERGGVRDLKLEEVLIDLDRGLVDFTWRKQFQYEFIPHEPRSVTLRSKGIGASS